MLNEGVVLVNESSLEPIWVHAEVTNETYGLTTDGATVDDLDAVPAWGTTFYY